MGKEPPMSNLGGFFMRLSKDRFSLPFCILDDDLPDKALRLLVFLFRSSDVAGCCSPGYEVIKTGAGLASDATVASSIRLLQKHGWFHFIKKGGGKKAVFWLRIPPRFTNTDRSIHDHLKIKLLPRK